MQCMKQNFNLIKILKIIKINITFSKIIFPKHKSYHITSVSTILFFLLFNVKDSVTKLYFFLYMLKRHHQLSGITNIYLGFCLYHNSIYLCHYILILFICILIR